MQQNLPIKDTNSVPIENQSNSICSKHNQKYEYISPTEKQLYCMFETFLINLQGQECKNQLSIQQTSTGPILTFLQAQDLIKKQNVTLVSKLETQCDICQQEQKPKMNYNTNQGLQIIKNAEEEILLSVQNYFKELRKNYSIMSLSYPCQENQEVLVNQIKTTLLKVQEYQKASTAGQLTSEQLLNYLNSDYSQTTTEYAAIVHSFSEKSANGNKQPPEVFIDKKCLHNLDQLLSNYVQTHISIGKTLPEELNLMNTKTEATMLATFHSPNLIVYDINSAKTNTYKQSGNFPSSSSLIVTPSNTIYLSGGVFENGTLSNTFYKTADSNQTLQQKANMIVKRAGHSMCYLNKEIYVIGGVSNDHCQTKLCEKFSETTEKWTRIGKLQNPRSRVGLVVDENKKQIYAFFGFASNSTVNSIERFEVSNNQWTLIQLKNQFQWQATGASAACQLNQSEILIFGGFAEQNEQQCCFQNNLLIYNLESNSIVKLNKLIPSDYINSNSSPAIVHNEKILTVGCFSGCKQGDISCLQNTDYLIEIDKKMISTIKTLFVSDDDPQQSNPKNIEEQKQSVEVPKPVEVPNPAQQATQQNSPQKQQPTITIQQPEQVKNEKNTQNSPEKKK